MAKVELNIVALGDFSSVTSQIKSLQDQVAMLQKNMAGVGVSSSFAKELANVNAAFKQTMLSTGQFTASTVKLTSETEKFGQALVNGKLKLGDYFNIIKQRTSEATTQMKALAVEQTKLQNSIIMNDPSKQGLLSVYTPTQIDKVANATKIAANEANLYAIAVKKGAQELSNWGKNTQWAGRQLTVGMSVPLMIFGQQAVSTFKDVNTELTKLQRLYGEGLTPPSQAELNKISDQVLKLGKDIAGSMGIAQTETVKAAANFAAMGRQGQNLLDTTAQTMRLSKLGAVSTADATNTVVALQNVYKVSTYQLADAVNFLSDIQKQTTMTLGDMTQAIPRVGPIMTQLGGTYKDTAVMLVAMREAGIPAAQAANAVKSAMASLIAPTAAATKEAKGFGISLEAVKNAGTPVQMIEKLQEGLAKLTPLAKEQVIEKIFGKFQFARISALLDNFGKTGSQTVNALKIAGATSAELATLANQEMKQATESPTARYQRALESFKATLVPVGQEIIKIATKLMDFGNAIGKIFSGLPGPIKAVMGAIAIGVAISGPIIMLTGLVANFASFLLKGLFNLKQLATGGKTLGQILTPELVAAQNASSLFESGIAGDVDAVNLLSKAIQDLTRNIENMVNSFSQGTGLGRVLQDVATSARAAEQMPLPGFADGKLPSGLVPGTGSGKVDTFPAMLAPGELVIDSETTKKYWPILSRVINKKIPGFHEGTYIDSKGNHQPLGPHTHAGQEQVGKNTRVTENSGNIVYVGPQAGQEGSGSAPSPLSGMGSYISRMSGVGNKYAQEVTPAVNDTLNSLGFGPLEESSQRAQVGMMHISPKRMSLPGDDPSKGTRKVWDFPDVAAGSQGENQFLNYFNKDLNPSLQPYMLKKAEEAQKAMLEGITDPKKIKAIQQAFATINASDQPTTKEGIQLIKSISDGVINDIKAGVTSDKIIKDGKITGAGKDIVWTNEIAKRQMSGQLPDINQLTGDKWLTEANANESATPAALNKKNRSSLSLKELTGVRVSKA